MVDSVTQTLHVTLDTGQLEQDRFFSFVHGVLPPGRTRRGVGVDSTKNVSQAHIICLYTRCMTALEYYAPATVIDRSTLAVYVLGESFRITTNTFSMS